jgi:hypothetical protein
MSHIPYYGQQEPENKRTGKNGYELRAQLVELAKTYVENRHKNTVEYFDKLAKFGMVSTEEYLKAIKPYDITTVMEQAHKMYDFVLAKK